MLVDAAAADTVACTEPGYPVYERGALFARRPAALPLLAENGFLPDLDAVDERRGARRRSSGSTTRTTRRVRSPRSRSTSGWRRRARARFVLASDEAYTELWFDEPPASALQVRTCEHRRVQHALQAVVDDWLPLRVRRGERALDRGAPKFRPNVGTAPQEFVQRAAVAAWGDEEHVEADARCTAASALFLDLFARNGILWPAARRRCTSGSRCRTGETSVSFAERLLDHGVVVAPGSYFGAGGRGLRPVRARPDRGRVRRGGRRPEGVL